MIWLINTAAAAIFLKLNAPSPFVKIIGELDAIWLVDSVGWFDQLVGRSVG